MRDHYSIKLARQLPGYALAGLLVLGLFGFGLYLTGKTAFSQAQPYKVTWNLPNPPTEARVGLRLSISNLELSNSGGQAWAKTGPDQLRLAFRWYGSDNKPLDPKNKDNGYEELRADLPQDIPAGGRVLYPQFLVAVPATAGDYTLHIDLVQGADGWLADKGSPDLNFKVTVRAKDTAAPTARILALPLFETATAFTVKWDGKDEDNGSGVAQYDVQYKVAGDADWRDWLLNTSATSALFSGDNGKIYLFRARASDRAGNAGKYTGTEQASTRVDSLPPSARVEALPGKSAPIFLVRWSSFDNIAGAATALCDVQYREGSSGPWTDWLTGTSTGSALFNGEPGKTYSFRVRATDYAGNTGEFPAEAQATTTTSAALGTLFALAAGPASTGSAAQAPATSSTTAAATTAAATTPAETTTAATTGGATTTAAGTTPAATTTGTATTPSAGATTPAGTATPASGVAATGPQSAFFPLVSKAGENGLGTTTIMVYNPGTTPLDVFVRFNLQAGAPMTTTVNNQAQAVSADAATGLARAETVLRTVGPGETINVWAGLVPQGSYTGWAEVRSAGAFQAYAVRQPATGRPLQYAPATTGQQLFLPYVKKADQVSSTYLDLANPNPNPADFTITYYDAASGNVLATDKRTLPRFGSARLPASAIATADPNLRFSGSAVISSTAALAVSAETLLEDGTPVSYPAQAGPVQPSGLWPVYRDTDGVTTALLVQNTAKDPVNLKLEFLDSKGTAIASKEQSLAGFARLTFWEGDLKELAAGFSGQVRVSAGGSNGTVAVTVLGAPSSLKNRQFS